MKCFVCKSDHVSMDCGQLRVVNATANLPQSLISELDTIISLFHETNKLSGTNISDTENMMELINSILEEKFPNFDVKLSLYGTSVNGFGSTWSDSDMSFLLRRKSNRTMQSMNWVLWQEIAMAMRNAGFTKAEPIRAKVCLVKWEYGDLHGDLTYNNEAAMVNSELLRRYCDWDRRLPQLGLYVKEWAKYCDMGDAATGGLSSYTWIILVVHFLQRTSPPVLPFLQEKQYQDNEPITGRNEFFYSGPIDPEWSKNMQSIGELFLQFLEYFSNFDWQSEVVQIRQLSTLKKSDMRWLHLMCIQDPFLIYRNLGMFPKLAMAIHIRKTFVKTYNAYSDLNLKKQFCEANELPHHQPIPVERIVDYENWLLGQCHVEENVPKQSRQ